MSLTLCTAPQSSRILRVDCGKLILILPVPEAAQQSPKLSEALGADRATSAQMEGLPVLV
jgi:hypothetical protein